MDKLALIVDDNRALAEDLAEILEGEGYRIRIFDDPEVALREAQSLPFDVALLDVRMPGMDGVTLQALLMKGHPQARFVLMTAYADERSISEGLAAGASAVLTKPVPVEQLFAALGDLRSRDLLLVEDDDAFRETLSEALAQEGYRCHGVASASEARSVLAARREAGQAPALAIIDVRLPDGSGAVLARELAQTGLRCILITGWDPAEVDVPEKTGPRILVKPFSADTLLRALVELRGARS